MDTQAIPFIRYNGKFEINPDARQFLESLSDDVPLAVISIVGKYRTGKSFFVNRVLLNRSQDDGFSVGPTINPCTKGLWLWTELLPTGNPEHPNMKAIVIDTEGFGGMDENVNHDTRIFLFSLLLSSYFIYNSVGSIDENALNNISLIVNLAKEIQMKSQDDQVDTSQYFPAFLWVVRDFALQMVDQTGSPIASREYLEKALEQQKGLSDSVEQKNRIRRLIRHFFRERDCITMVRPVEAEKDLQRLDQMKNNELRVEFVDQIKLVQSKIFKKVKPKSVQGSFMTGPMLLQLALAYVQTMNSGKVPDVESAWGFVCRAEGEKAVQECSLEMEKLLNTFQNKVLNSVEMNQTKLDIKERVMKMFRQKAIGQEEDLKIYRDKINSQLEVQYKQLKNNNKQNQEEYYKGIVAKTLQYIEDKLRNEEYSNFFELQSEMFKFKEQFEKDVLRSNQSTKFFDNLSLQIYQQAAERLSRKAVQQYVQEQRRLEYKNQQLDQELQQKRNEQDSERTKLNEQIQKLEREKSQLTMTEQNLNEKLNRCQRDYDRSEQQCDDLKTSLRDKDLQFNAQYVDQYNQLKIQLERARQDIISQQSNFDKESALLRQENSFLNRETQSFQDKIQYLELENKKQRQENLNQAAQNDALSQRNSQLDQGRAQEIQKLQQEFERKVQELTEDINRKKQQVRQQNEWLVEKNYLENQVSFLKNQLEENKRLHDALLIALQQGMNSQDSENNQELVQTNRNLSAAMDKIEMRCKILEEKAEKLKKFKRMIKSCSTLQCLHCQKTISQPIFNQHLNNCNGVPQSTDLLSASVNLYHRQSSALINLTQIQGGISNVDLSLLQISINQTMVRETSDNKPYTEYMIKVQYGERKWTVSRRYKNFCELHQSMLTQFPGMKLPDSSQAIINVSDINNIFQSKRPTVIEDRRKALQQYIRDLAKIDIIRNCKSYKQFLDIEQEDTPNLNQTQSRSISQVNSPINLDNIQQLHSSRDQLKEQKQKQQNSQPISVVLTSARSSFSGKEIPISQVPLSRAPLKDNQLNTQLNSYRIDRKLLPQSPQSFLKSWNEKQQGEKHRENTQRFTSDHNVFMNNF